MTGMPLRTDGPVTLMNAEIPASEPSVAQALVLLHGILEAEGICEDARSDVRIAMAEILNNIVEHSVAGLAGATIAVDVVRDGARLLVETLDHGRPLPPSLLASAELPEIGDDVASLPEGGFGWFIIHSLAQDMMYEREAGANRLSFAFDIG